MPDLLGDGIFYFNAGSYFEAHEAWEDLWRVTRGPLRLFYQGLIQAAVGLHHLSHGKLNAAQAQISKGLAKLQQYPGRFCQIDNEKLIADLREVLETRSSQHVIIRVVGGTG